MHYLTDCGHILKKSPSSSIISEHGWKDYENMYLSNCPICESKYPYLKQLDNKVRPQTENLIYRLLEVGHKIHIPPASAPTKSIRIKNVNKSDLGIEVEHQIVKKIDEYENDVLIRIYPR
jgi:hypothetical protein